jgi:type IV pilus assembly protein PilW
MTMRRLTPSSRPSGMRGLTLVELMVSLVLGLILIGAMLTLLARNSHNSMELERSSRQVENGRYALQRVAEDLRHAGYYGDYLGAGAPSGAAPDPCLTATAANLAALKDALAWRIQAGTAAATPPSCIDANDFVAGSNWLAVRFAHPSFVIKASDPLPSGFPETGKTYFQANSGDLLFATSLVTGANGVDYYAVRSPRTTGDIRSSIFRYITRIYFLSPCTRLKAGQAHCTSDADDGAPVPSLKMIELGSVAFSDPIAVSEGIERLELDYGIDSNGDGTADSYSRCAAAAPCSAADWGNVVAVRLSVLARNAEASAGFSDTKTYSMGVLGTASAPTGKEAFKRHAYQAVVRLNNTSMPREL